MSSAAKQSLHPAVVEGFISPGAWSLVENNFSQYAKDLLTKVVRFVVVSSILIAFTCG